MKIYCPYCRTEIPADDVEDYSQDSGFRHMVGFTCENAACPSKGSEIGVTLAEVEDDDE